MLSMYRKIIKMVREGVDAVLAEIATGRDQIREALDDVVPEIERDYYLEPEPLQRISSDAEVMPAAASRKHKPDASTLSGRKLRKAYVDAFDEDPDGRWSDETIRARIQGVE